MTITFPSNTKETIDAIREAIGREITIWYTVSGIPCTNPDDSLDPNTGLPTNQFCPVCGGLYWLNTVAGYTALAHITHLGMDIPVWVQGGFIYDGDLKVQIEYTASAQYVVDRAEYYEVDGKNYIKKSITPRGVPNINRYIITLVEKE